MSKIFLFLCLSFIIGITLRSFFILPIFVLWILSVSSLMLIIIFKKDKTKIIIGFCLLFILLGIFRFSQTDQKEFHAEIQGLNEKINFQGLVDESPIIESNQKIIIRKSDDKERILITIPLYPQYQYGDLLSISGKLKKPEKIESFDYPSYLAKDNIYFIMDFPKINILTQNKGNWLYSKLLIFKQNFENIINSVLPEPQASFMTGLILGIKRSIPKNLIEDFKRTGTSHIIALSGMNITIIGSFLISLLEYLAVPKKYSFWLAVISIILFTLMTGASASVVRAAIMGIIILTANRAGRLYSAFPALILAGVLMLWQNPKILRFDLGFQLSFLAVLGLIYISPFFQEKFKPIPNILDLKEILITTIAAQIATTPLILYYFGTFSLIAPLVNILVLPTIPITMFFGFLTGLIGFFSLFLAKIFAMPAWLLLTYKIKIISMFSSLSFASLEIGNISIFFIVLYYLAVVFFIFKNKTFNIANKN